MLPLRYFLSLYLSYQAKTLDTDKGQEMKTYKIYATHINTNSPFFINSVQAQDSYDALKQAYLMYGRSYTWVLGVEVA